MPGLFDKAVSGECPFVCFSALHTCYGHDHAGDDFHVGELIAVAKVVLPFN